MTYNKPVVAVLGDATRVIQITHVPKQVGPLEPPDFSQPSNPDPAYEVDE